MTGSGETEGPAISALVRRLLDTPGDFLAEPRLGSAGTVVTEAVVADLLRDLRAPDLATLPADWSIVFRVQDTPAHRRWLRAVLITAWLLHDPWFVGRVRAPAVRDLLCTGIAEIAAFVDPPLLVTDPDRREELARRCLALLELVPAGETPAQAADRLTTLDSAEQARVIAASRYAEERAEAVRQAMHDQAAAEAAAKASRE